MTLPSKYRSPNSHSVPPFVYAMIISASVTAVILYIGFLLTVEKYGEVILYGWTIQDTLILVGFVASFVLIIHFLNRLFSKLGRQSWEVQSAPKFMYVLGLGLAVAIFVLKVLSIL